MSTQDKILNIIGAFSKADNCYVAPNAESIAIDWPRSPLLLVSVADFKKAREVNDVLAGNRSRQNPYAPITGQSASELKASFLDVMADLKKARWRNRTGAVSGASISTDARQPDMGQEYDAPLLAAE